MTNSIKQIKAKLINEISRKYKNKIKQLTERNTQLSKSNWELLNKNGILNEKVQELEEKLSQYEDWNRRLQEFMDMEPDERDKVFKEYKIQKELNIKIKPILNTIYDCLFKSV